MNVIVGVHHVGIVVKDIAEAADTYVKRYGYDLQSEIIHDPVQTAYVQFLKLSGQPPYIELVAPDSERSKLSNSLKKGGGLNHICYGAPDIEAACQKLQADGMMIIQLPVDAVAFPGRRIAWMMGNDCVPIELVETSNLNHL